jgi:hypothetical protein
MRQNHPYTSIFKSHHLGQSLSLTNQNSHFLSTGCSWRALYPVHLCRPKVSFKLVDSDTSSKLYCTDILLDCCGWRCSSILCWCALPFSLSLCYLSLLWSYLGHVNNHKSICILKWVSRALESNLTYSPFFPKP